MLTASLALATLASPPSPFLAAPLAPPPPAQQARGARVEAPPAAMSWTMLEVRALWRDVDATGDDMQGIDVRGAYELGEGLFVVGRVEGSGESWYGSDVDLLRTQLGLGHHVLLHRDVDAFAQASWVHLDLDGNGFDETDDGWRAELGIRGMMDDVIELEARIGWQDVGNDGFLWGLDLRWWALEHFAVGIGYEQEIDDAVAALSLRYAF
jgi:hypothetical protein